MKRYFLYLLIYSIGGFVLERIINLIFLGYWWDNSVLYGPYQPLYGSGVVLTVLFMEYFLPRLKWTPLANDVVLLVMAIVFTGAVEAATGYGYEALTDIHLWDYGQTFACRLEYVCVFPTSLFGFLSFLVVKYLHPIIKRYLDNLDNRLSVALAVIFTADVIVTLIVVL